MKEQKDTFIFTSEIKQLFKFYEDKYIKQFNGRKLSWIYLPELLNAEVNMNYKGKKKILGITTYQLCLLMHLNEQFNDYKCETQKILDVSKLSQLEFKAAFSGFTNKNTAILMEKDGEISVNPAMPAKVKIVCNPEK